ncbi:MAG: DMT family transporter [Sulfurimonadaceae bacterium]|jgi:drug/metabolite transporter (DMT)-like permease|nr:DMT family transporter [Arcobacteraceae bacterium]
MKIKIYILLALCVLFWSSNFILGRYLHEEFEPITLAFYRWLGVFIAVLPFFILYFNAILTVIKKEWLLILLLAFFSIVCFNTLLYFGLEKTTATNALLINSIFPMLVLFLSLFILKTTITNNQIVGIILSTLGVLFIVFKADFSQIGKFELNRGDVYIMSATLTWALYSVLLKYKKIPLNPTQFFTTMVVVGFMILLPIYIYSTQSLEADIVLVHKHYDIILFMVIFPSILSFLFWNKGILEIGAEKTGQFTHLMPIFGTILAFLFLDERILFYHFIGMIFIFVGIYLSQFYKKELFKR